MATRIAEKHPLVKELNPADRARLDSFLKALQDSRLKLGHVSNIPDNLWRDDEVATVLGAPAHFYNAEKFSPIEKTEDFFNQKLPLDFELARKSAKANLFKEVGSAPWRAQQFTDLYTWALKNYPTLDDDTRKTCDRFRDQVPHPTLLAITYAGLLSHFTGDSSNPYHASADYDGRLSGQRGLHSFWESVLVEEIDDATLVAAVTKLAETYQSAGPELPGSVAALKAKVASLYGKENENSVVGLVIAELGDSFSHHKEILELDLKYAVPTGAEALTMVECKDIESVRNLRNSLKKLSPQLKKTALEQKLLAGKDDHDDICRRNPHTLTDDNGNVVPAGTPGARSVVDRNFTLITSRLGIAAALTADIWMRKWVEAGEPYFCFTFQFPHKPSFVSPTDPNCYGYALKEDPKSLLLKNKQSALEAWKNAESTDGCVKF